jgi:hypothetical protein
MKKELTEQEEQYLQGKMNTAERAAFEASLSTEPAHLAQLREQRALLEAIHEEQWMKKFAAWEQESPLEVPPVAPPKSGLIPKIGALLLLVVGVLVGGIWLFRPPTPSSPVEPQEQKIDPGTNPDNIKDDSIANITPVDTPTKRQSVARPLNPIVLAYAVETGREFGEQLMRTKYKGQTRNFSNLSPDDTLYIALSAFNQGKVDSTLLWLKHRPNSAEGLLLRGITLLHTGQLPAAITTLRQLAARPDNPYQQETQWYLLLCYRAQLPARQAEYKAQKAAFDAVAGQYFQQKLAGLERRLGL